MEDDRQHEHGTPSEPVPRDEATQSRAKRRRPCLRRVEGSAHLRPHRFWVVKNQDEEKRKKFRCERGFFKRALARDTPDWVVSMRGAENSRGQDPSAQLALVAASGGSSCFR